MRRAIMQVSVELIANIGTGKFETIEAGLPDDAKVIAGVVDKGILNIILESNAFEDIAMGDELPVLPCPVIRRLEGSSIGKRLPSIPGGSEPAGPSQTIK